MIKWVLLHGIVKWVFQWLNECFKYVNFTICFVGFNSKLVTLALILTRVYWKKYYTILLILSYVQTSNVLVILQCEKSGGHLVLCSQLQWLLQLLPNKLCLLCELSPFKIYMDHHGSQSSSSYCDPPEKMFTVPDFLFWMHSFKNFKRE